MPDPVEAQIADNAAWATQFRNAAVNPAQRARYQQQIKAGDEQQQKQADAQFERTLATDKGAQDLYFRQRSDKRAERASDLADDRYTQQYIRDSRAKDNADNLERHKTLDYDLKVAHDRAKSDAAAKQKEQTISALNELNDLNSQGLRNGSPEHVAATLKIVAGHTDADPVILHQILGDAKIKGDPGELIDHLAGMSNAELARTRFSYTADGKLSTSTGPEPVAKPAADELSKTYDELHKVSSELSSYYDNEGKLKNGMNQTVLRQVRDRQQALSSKIDALKAPAPQQDAPDGLPSDLPATVAASETRQIFKDAAGNRAYKNPDGSFEPVQ